MIIVGSSHLYGDHIQSVQGFVPFLLFVCCIIVCLFAGLFERKVHYVGVTY